MTKSCLIFLVIFCFISCTFETRVRPYDDGGRRAERRVTCPYQSSLFPSMATPISIGLADIPKPEEWPHLQFKPFIIEKILNYLDAMEKNHPLNGLREALQKKCPMQLLLFHDVVEVAMMFGDRVIPGVLLKFFRRPLDNFVPDWIILAQGLDEVLFATLAHREQTRKKFMKAFVFDNNTKTNLHRIDKALPLWERIRFRAHLIEMQPRDVIFLIDRIGSSSGVGDAVARYWNMDHPDNINYEVLSPINAKFFRSALYTHLRTKLFRGAEQEVAKELFGNILNAENDALSYVYAVLLLDSYANGRLTNLPPPSSPKRHFPSDEWFNSENAILSSKSFYEISLILTKFLAFAGSNSNATNSSQEEGVGEAKMDSFISDAAKANTKLIEFLTKHRGDKQMKAFLLRRPLEGFMLREVPSIMEDVIRQACLQKYSRTIERENSGSKGTMAEYKPLSEDPTGSPPKRPTGSTRKNATAEKESHNRPTSYYNLPTHNFLVLLIMLSVLVGVLATSLVIVYQVGQARKERNKELEAALGEAQKYGIVLRRRESVQVLDHI